MSSIETSVSCMHCGVALPERTDTLPAERKPCPDCGSLTRTFHVHITETVTVLQKIGTKHKRPGKKKPIFESVTGDDLHRATGKWNKLTREIDRENDHYREIIVDPETGNVLRECDEPLSEHIGRGTAKAVVKNDGDSV